MRKFIAALLLASALGAPAATPAAPEPPDTQQYMIVLRLVPHYQDEKHWTDQEKLVLAGRSTNTESMGVVILEVGDEAEARAVMDNDAAVKAGIMTAELLPFQVALSR